MHAKSFGGGCTGLATQMALSRRSDLQNRCRELDGDRVREEVGWRIQDVDWATQRTKDSPKNPSAIITNRHRPRLRTFDPLCWVCLWFAWGIIKGPHVCMYVRTYVGMYACMNEGRSIWECMCMYAF